MIVEVPSDHLEELLPMAHAFYEESKSGGTFSEERWLTQWKFLIDSNAGFILAYARGNRPVGSIGGMLAPHPNEDETICMEAFWYFLPEERGKGIAPIKLMKKYEQVAKERGAGLISMACLDHLDSGRLSNLYEKMGYRPIERSFLKRV